MNATRRQWVWGAALASCAIAWAAGCSGNGSGLGSQGDGSQQDEDGSAGSGQGSSGKASSGSGSSGSGSSGSGSSGSGSSGSGSGQDASSSSGSSHDSGASNEDAATTDAGSDPCFDQAHEHNLQVLNNYRAMVGAPALTLDSKLCAFALAGSQEFSMTMVAHQHFNDFFTNMVTPLQNEANAAATSGNYSQAQMYQQQLTTLLTANGFNTSEGENEGYTNMWSSAQSAATNEDNQIDQLLAGMWAEGPGTGEAHGHYENIVNTAYKRVGAGFVYVGNELFLTNDFSN